MHTFYTAGYEDPSPKEMIIKDDDNLKTALIYASARKITSLRLVISILESGK